MYIGIDNSCGKVTIRMKVIFKVLSFRFFFVRGEIFLNSLNWNKGLTGIFSLLR